MDFDNCAEESNDKLICISENKMRFVVNNPSEERVRKILVDGCLIVGDKIRCDYLFELYDPKSHVIYVELKGSGINKAFCQLSSTIGCCEAEHKDFKKYCYIVASRFPRHGPKVQVLKKKFYRKHKVLLNIKTRYVEFLLPPAPATV